MFKQHIKALGLVLAILLLTGAFFLLTQGAVGALKP